MKKETTTYYCDLCPEKSARKEGIFLALQEQVKNLTAQNAELKERNEELNKENFEQSDMIARLEESK